MVSIVCISMVCMSIVCIVFGVKPAIAYLVVHYYFY
jgi:hypothetical protein